MKKIVILHNIISPYKTTMFNHLHRMLLSETDLRLEVVYFAETASNRDWIVHKEHIKYPYVLLNKGALENVSSGILCRQILCYFYQQRAEISILIAGEYILPAYWMGWMGSFFFKYQFGALLESHEDDHPRTPWKEYIKKIFFSRCSFVLAAGRKHARYAIKLGVPPLAIGIIHGVGGVDTVQYQHLMEEYRNISRQALCYKLGVPYRKYFIYVGRFSEEKNLLFFLKGFNVVQKDYPNWGILMVGSGPQESELKEYIKEHQIENVEFTGFIQQEQLPLYYMVSEVHVLPSVSEPWGLVADEALSLGVPVLVSNRCGCLEDVVCVDKNNHDVNGWSFDPTDDTELIIKLQHIMSNADERKLYSVNALATSRKYTSEYSARCIAEIIKRVNENALCCD